MHGRGERRLTRQVHAIGEEVAGIGDEDDQAALDLRHASHQSVLQTQRSSDTHDHTNQHATKENEQEEPNSFEEVQEGQRASLTLRVFLCRLKQHDSNGIVEDGLAKDHRIQLRLDLVQVEDSQDSDWIRGRKCSADRDSLNKRNIQPIERDPCPEEQDQAEDNGRDKGTGEGEGEDGADVAEEIRLVKFVPGGEDDRREEEVEEELVVEGDAVLEVRFRCESNDKPDEHP